MVLDDLLLEVGAHSACYDYLLVAVFVLLTQVALKDLHALHHALRILGYGELFHGDILLFDKVRQVQLSALLQNLLRVFHLYLVSAVALREDERDGRIGSQVQDNLAKFFPSGILHNSFYLGPQIFLSTQRAAGGRSLAD